MSKHRKTWKLQEKLEALEYYKIHGSGKTSRHFGVSTVSIRKWSRQYERDGKKGLGKITESKPKVDHEICLLCTRLNIQEFSLFGSTMNGKFQEGKSDIDCFIKTRPEDMNKIVQLEFELRKIFNTKIDIFHSDWEIHQEIEEYIESNKFVVYKAVATNKV